MFDWFYGKTPFWESDGFYTIGKDKSVPCAPFCKLRKSFALISNRLVHSKGVKMRSKLKELTREVIISKLVETLKPIDFVQAFFEGGAAAFNRIDEWSDIDVYLIVDDDKVSQTFQVAEETLKMLSWSLPTNMIQM